MYIIYNKYRINTKHKYRMTEKHPGNLSKNIMSTNTKRFMKHYACIQIMSQLSANSILYFTYSISWPVYRQLMPKPDKKEGRKGGKERKEEFHFFLYYSHLV